MGQALQGEAHEQGQVRQALMRLGRLIEDIARSSVSGAIRSSGFDRQREIELRRQEELQAEIENARGGDEIDSLAQEADVATDAPQRAEEPVRAAPQMGRQESGVDQGDQKIDHDSIVDQLNIIRAGKSMDDRNIEQSLKDFISGLGNTQRTTFFKMLQGISKIVAPNVPTRMKPPPEEPEADKAARLDMLAQRRTDVKPDARDTATRGHEPAPQTDAPVRRDLTQDDEEEHQTRRQPPIRPKQRPVENVRRSKLLLQD